MKGTYSVWNPNHAGFDYYEGEADLREGVIAPTPSLPSGGRLGLTPEQASRRLPSGAKFIGKGQTPMGMIATRNGGSAAMGDFLGLETGTLFKAALLVGGGWYIWTRVLSPTQRRKATVYAYKGKRKKRRR
jgi:hypothetical protein